MFLGDIIVENGDYVTLQSSKPNQPTLIARIAYMFADLIGLYFHAEFLCRGSDTILGDCALPRELFVFDQCYNLPLGTILHKVNVQKKTVNYNLFHAGMLIKFTTFFTTQQFKHYP